MPQDEGDERRARGEASREFCYVVGLIFGSHETMMAVDSETMMAVDNETMMAVDNEIKSYECCYVSYSTGERV